MKQLIVYYSLEGNTEKMAGMIAEKTGADTLRLVPKTDVPKDGGKKFMTGGAMATFNKGTPLRPYNIDLSKYDNIIIGTPVWAGKSVPAINQFLMEHDVADKVTSVFTLSGSGNDRKCIRKLMKKLPHISNVATFYDAKMAKPQEAAQNDSRLELFLARLWEC